MPAPLLSAVHARRLREVWRSAGWPCQDMVEVELLAAGLLRQHFDGGGRAGVALTDAGLAALAQSLRKNRAARDGHEALVERVALSMHRAGRIAWRGLSLRAHIGVAEGGAWAVAMPDVFSIRQTTVEDYLQPIAHEIKVRRADLLADLRRPAKREAYLQLSSECWYVIREGIATADEIPGECGVLLALGAGFEVLRVAPKRAMKLPFAVWMALARATPVDNSHLADAQGRLGDCGTRDLPDC